MVDKILKGIPSAKIPLERPELHQLILSLDIARAIGVNFSAEVLNRADELVGASGMK